MQTIKIIVLAGLSTSHQCLCGTSDQKIISRKFFFKKIMFLTQVLFLAILVQFSDQQSNRCAIKEDVGKLVESENATGAEIKELVDTVNEVRLEIRNVKETTDKQTEEHTRLTQVIKEVDRVTADKIRELRSEIRAIKETLDKLTESENTTADEIMELVIETSNELRSEIRNITNKQTEEHTKLTQVIKEVDRVTVDEIRELAGTLNVLQSEIRNITKKQTEDHTKLTEAIREADNATGDEIRELAGSLNELRSEIRSIKEMMDTQMEEHNELKKLLPRKGSFPNPASSCSDLLKDSPSGEYWIVGKTNHPIRVYCDMTRRGCGDTAEGWMRVVDSFVNENNRQCPDGLGLAHSTRNGARVNFCSTPPIKSVCESAIFPVNGTEYSQVCGSILAYPTWRTNRGFGPYHDNPTLTIDDLYVDGISITHGQSPRKHIWTLAAANDDFSSLTSCPCVHNDIDFAGTIPSFVGQDYFCDSKDPTPYWTNSLWDGQGCGGNSTCCSFNNSPWFCKQLQQPTTDDIELRLCDKYGKIYIYSFKIFVK